MTDEQFEKLVGALKPVEKARWQNLVDNSLGLVLGALAVGFFALLWESKNDVDGRAAKLEARAAGIEQSILGLQDTLKKEIGDLAGPVAVQTSIQETVVIQSRLLQDLDSRLDLLERRTTNAVAAVRPPVLNTNAVAMNPPVFPTIKSEELLKAVRDK